MPFSPRSSPTRPAPRSRWRSWIPLLALSLLLSARPAAVHAQAAEEVLSQREVDTLRDTAFSPRDRVLAFVQFLDDRQRRIQELVATRRGHTDYGGDLHDVLDQFGQIADELNDNLDEYSRQHRDIRKALPKLLQATDRWTATLKAPSDNEAYGVVRRLAIDNVKDTHDIAATLGTDLSAYFQAHPEALKEERRRDTSPHAVRPE